MSKSILIVEDDPGLGALIRKRMIGKGYSVLLAKNGEVAFRQQMLRNSDLVLLDCFLPDMDGFNFIRQMKDHEMDLPVIVMTGSSDIRKAVEFMKKGAVDYIIKDDKFWEKLPVAVDMAFKKISFRQDIANLGGQPLSIHENMYLIEHSPDPVLIVVDDQIVFAQKEIEEIIKRDALEGTVFSELIHPYDRFVFTSQSDEKPFNENNFFEVRVLSGNAKEVIWLHLSGVNIDWHGSEAALYYLRDCTPFKEVESALKTTEKRLTFAMEAGCDGLWDWNLELDEIYFSPRYYDILSIKPGDAPDNFSEWLKLVNDNDREHVKDRLTAACSPEEVVEMEFRMISGDNRTIWLFCRAKVVDVDEYNKPLRIIGSVIDINRWKK